MDLRPSWNKTFIDIVEVLAKRSLCLKLKTAAIIVKDTQIISIGYNGTYSKCIECNEFWKEEHKKNNLTISFDEWLNTEEFKDMHREWSKLYEVHAEANALANIKRADANNCVMYTLYAPCDACAKAIKAYGIQLVYYKHKYKHGDDALERLNKLQVSCVQINE